MSYAENHVSIVVPMDDEQIKDKKKHRNCFAIIGEFSQNTSAHGIPGIARGETIYNRIYWSVALLGCTAFMIYLIAQAVLAYFDYPTQIDLSIDSEWPQYFPAFSFCNVGAMRLDLFIGPFVNYTNARNVTGTNDTTTLSLEQILLISDFTRDTLNNNGSMEPFFYSLSVMLYSCTFNNVKCSQADFIPFVTSTYGLCYTFNARLKNGTNGSVCYGNTDGGVGKLDLGLYVHSNQYIPYLINSVGIIGLIHDNQQAPRLDASGFNLVPGQKHVFSYRKKTNFFLPAPYTSCTNQAPSWMQAAFANYPRADYGYSQDLCIVVSIQIYTYEKCGCVNPVLWDSRSMILPNSSDVFRAPLCRINNSCFITAADEYMNSSFDTSSSAPDCPQECSITDFIVKESSLLTPLEWEMPIIKRFVEKSSVPLPRDWSNTWPAHIRRNYLAVSVVRETNIVENNTQIASISVSDVLSNIGGQTGLWIGISLLSIMELIEMFYRLVRYQGHRLWSIFRTK